MIRSLSFVAVLSCLLANGAVLVHSDEVRFDRDIRPLLSDNCFHCHGPAEAQREADLRLDIEDEAKASTIVPGSPTDSELYSRLISDDPDTKMPPLDSNKQLTDAQIDLFKRWIEQGAKWSKHWSFEAPVQASLPEVAQKDWLRNAIDHFVLHRLEQEGLQPAAAADRRTLIRRLSFDLTGLTPTLEEVQAFVDDNSANAYDNLVDRLLSSPHYGERMAVMWLDAARYGDTSVYHADGFRDMWGWRDRVVEAYNENQSFDQFSIEQLAGDLLPDAAVKQQVAAGFNRNNGTTDEGGLIAEEYRVEYAVDRVKTTATVWMGLTLECTQCHEHKYDPFTQEDYYRFFAFFNRSADGGEQSRNGNSGPMVKVLDPEKQIQLPEVHAQLAEYEKKMGEYSSSPNSTYKPWVVEAEKRASEQQQLPDEVIHHFPFQEGKGKKVSDSVNPEQNGEIDGNAIWVEGRYDKAIKLDGNTAIRLGRIADFERTDSFSYGGWVWPGSKRTGAFMARVNESEENRGYDLQVGGDRNIQAHIIHDWPENAIRVSTKKTLPIYEWNHVFATYDGSSKATGIKIYVNGELWETDIVRDNLTESIRNSTSLRVGSRDPGTHFVGKADEIRVYARCLTDSEVHALASQDPLQPIFAVKAAERTDEQMQQLRQYFLENEDPQYRLLAKEHHRLKAKEDHLSVPLTTVMIMRDQEKPRDTFVLARGAYDSPTEQKVQPGTPPVFPPMAEGSPSNRLGMARWLFQDDHPLTARVAINRYWQMLFGVGFVATPEDFGSQGEFPSHPELLDWLAVDFRQSGWDVKGMLKQIVMSATYRQSSHVSPELSRRDPQNRFLAHGARFRLQSEFIRDNILALSGLLVDDMGGPGVKPYQPPGLWKEVGLGGKPGFVQDHDENLYKRSLYTYWKRSAPPPNMQLFDAPTREKCAVRRPRTNTPLQALVLLNDVQFVEAARCFAQRILKDGGESETERATYAFELATARKPETAELNVLLEVLHQAQDRYREDQNAAAELIATGESSWDEELDTSEHAAWTIVANVICNLDETVTRE
jgi:hypothetical protein